MYRVILAEDQEEITQDRRDILDATQSPKLWVIFVRSSYASVSSDGA